MREGRKETREDLRAGGIRKRISRPLVLTLITAVSLFAALPAQLQALTADQVFDRVRDSIVAVTTWDAQGKEKGRGSGVLLPSGKIATPCQVVEGGASCQVVRGKQLFRAVLYAEDANRDICLLDAKGVTGKPAWIGKAAGLKAGDAVYAVGAPRGQEPSFSAGIVGQKPGGTPPLIQTTAAVSPGSSGGGLFDGKGRLVGLTVLSPEGSEGLSFAIPAERIGDARPVRRPAAGRRTPDEWKKRAVELEKSADWQGLLDWCRKWTESEPKEAAAWTGLGYAGSKLSRHDDAIDAYRRSIGIAPENAETWYGLGVACDELKRYDEAIEAYRHAIRINPEDARVWLNLGFVYSNGKRYDEAIEAHRQVVRIDPGHAPAWTILVHLYIISGNRPAAREAIRQLRPLDPAKAESLDRWFGPW